MMVRKSGKPDLRRRVAAGARRVRVVPTKRLCSIARTRPRLRLGRPLRLPFGAGQSHEQAVPQTEATKRHYAGGSCRGGCQPRLRSRFTMCEVDPILAVGASIAQLMSAILSQRACGTRAGLKPAPT